MKSNKSTSLFPRELVLESLKQSFVKLNPRLMVKNPVMFTVEICTVLMIVATLYFLFAGITDQGSFGYNVAVSIILFITLLFANFAEAIAEARGKAQADSLRKTREETPAKMIVNGKVQVVSSSQLKKGDVFECEAGDVIPSDGEIIEGLASIDESAITGESAPVIREAGGDKSSVTGGTKVLSDKIRVQVTTQPGESFLDKMIALVEGASRQKTPNEIALTILLAGFTLVFVIVCATLKPFGDYVGTNITVAAFISLFVCLIPTTIGGLLSAIGIAGMDRALRANVITKSGKAVETAGDVDTLLLDKTGTITKGSLEVVDFFTADGQSIELSQLEHHSAVNGLVDLAIGKNTRSMFDATHRVIGGNATDQALMKFIGEETFRVLDADRDCVVSCSQGFNSTNKFSQARIDSLGKTFYKGAPERLLAVAKHYLDAEGNVKELNLDVLNQKIDGLATKAMRVLAFGYSEKELVENTINDDVVIIGLVGIRDDVRPEAKEAIEEVQNAGIQVVMITGDRLETAVAIAKDAGLLKDESDKALSSAQLNEMSDEEVKAIIPHIRVIARALPTDKSRMVRLCQEMNLVVGMTGDGVNDSPALKRADVGFAMGSGTEAAKEAGKIVILDDNFKSIKDAIWYGRTIYHNILKFCKFQLVINVTAVIVSAIAPFFGVEEPLKVTHLLFVNLVMDGLGAIMLGNEPALEKYMKEKPRRRDESIISKAMMAQILTMGAWLTVISFVYLKHPFFAGLFENEEQHLTGYFVLFIVSALFNGFNVRDDGFGIFKGLNENTGFLKVFFAIIFVQALIVNAPLVPLQVFTWIGNMFSCVPFGIKGWIAVILLAVTMIPVDLIRKCFVGKKN